MAPGKRGLFMQIEYARNVKSNLDIVNKKLLRASILRIVQQAASTNHLEFSLSADNSFYKNETINIIFESKGLGLSNNLVVVTNYRIINVTKSTVDTIVNGEKLDEDNVKDNLLFIDLTACQDNLYEGTYSLILNYRDNKKLIINSETETDAAFIKKNIKPLVLKYNERMVEIYNNLIEKNDNQPFKPSSLKIDPQEKTVQEIINEEEKEQAQSSSEPVNESKNTKQRMHNQNGLSNSNCHYSFGPAPKGYHQVDIIYAQSPTIEWISGNGNFRNGMAKALEELDKLMEPDDFVYNLRFTTQDMGDTFTVNLAGDLYKKNY